MKLATVALTLLLAACHHLPTGQAPTRPRPRPLTPPAPKPVPRLHGEPQLKILVYAGSKVAVDLLQPAVIDQKSIGQGTHVLSAKDSILSLNGQSLRIQEVDLVFANASLPTLACGEGRYRRRFASDFRLLASGDRVAVIEMIGMEAFLFGTLAKEVGQSWPLEALKAQSVVARSYAAAQYLKHIDRPWHLAAFETVDMAYAGMVEQPHQRLRTALEQTRGNLLLYRNMPVPAFFHACSGGRTELPSRVWPKRRCVDGVTPLDPIMPAVEDPWAKLGADALKQGHWDWRATIPLATLAEKLRPGSKDVIQGIRVLSRHPDSGRSGAVEIRWAKVGVKRISAADLRMAANPREVRSTLWTAFGVVGKHLVIQGRGFGHGVGLSQVSAYAMARDGGHLAPAILAHFYPGATLVRKW